MMSLLASAFTGALALLGSMFGGHMAAPSQQEGTTTMRMEHHASTTMDHEGGMGMGTGDMHIGSSSPMGMPAVIGKVVSIDGTSLSVIGRSKDSTASTTFSVDASASKVIKREVGTTTVSSIKVGDNVLIIGTLTNTTVAAKMILDGIMMPKPGDHKEMGNTKMGSSSPMHTGEMHGDMHMGSSSQMRMRPGMEMHGSMEHGGQQGSGQNTQATQPNQQ